MLNKIPILSMRWLLIGSRLSDGNPHGTPVDRDVGAADVARQRRSQERHYCSDLLRLAEASGRNVVANEGLPRRLGRMQPLQNLRGIDAAGRDAVDHDAVGDELEGERA